MSPGKKTIAPMMRFYFPAIVCVECDSPIDALVALCVPRDEAMNLVAASWRGNESTCVLATVDGGRSVAALRTPEGRWAACNAFLDKGFNTQGEAERELTKLLKRGRRGYVGALANAPSPNLCG
jgi:hypothetical protein